MNDPGRRTIKGYELRERIGAGGFGVVYRAYQSALDRDVAIKIILPEHANQPEFIRRFEIEAKTIARLEHPHIVPLYDFWRDPEGAYLVMRWLPTNLRVALQRGAWSLEDTALLLEQMAGALNIAHRERVIHRDIRPDNILLDEDNQAYLADFGIAQDLNRSRERENSQPLAALEYVTPEQIRGEATTPKTDIYSLGLVIYEMLVDEKPYPDAHSHDALIGHHLNTPLPLTRTKRGNIPAAIDEVLQTATAKQPEQRFSDVQRFATHFRAALPNRQRSSSQPIPEPLTPRELDVLRLLEQGLSNKEIADRLFISLPTVKWNTGQIYDKLAVHNRNEAVERARQLGILGGQPTRPTQPAPENQPQVTEADKSLLPVNDTLPLFNPYKGLRAFEEADVAIFYGRAALTEQLLGRLSSSGGGARFLAAVGASGSGKSSVIKAGLIPELIKGALPNSSRWFITQMVPGTHPFEELEAALLFVSTNPLPGILDQLNEDRRGLVRAVKRALPSDTDVELVLLIDQFEELFTLVTDEAVRAHFIDNLLNAVTDSRSRVRVVLTLRADFYDRPLQYPRLAELMRSHTEVIVPLTASELERAIVAPAEQVGLRFEEGLLATILKDAGEQPGTLPLLEYALSELYERRQDRLLTLEAYRQLGGISGALARRADDLYSSLDPAGQEVTRQMFLRLVTLGEGSEDTRRRVLQAELMSLLAETAAMEDVIEVFTQYRLLTLDHDPLTRGPTVEIAHEALIQAWGRLRGWLRESRDALRVQRRLMTTTADWIQSGRDAGFLTSGAWLVQFETLKTDGGVRLTREEKDYLDASIAAREQQAQVEHERQAHELELAQQAAESAQTAVKSQRQAANRLRSLVGFLALFLIVAAGLSIFAFNSRTDALAKGQLANDDAGTSEANFMRAEAQRLASDADDLQIRGGNSETIALLALRSMNLEYTPQGDEALTDAFFLDLPMRVLSGAHYALNDVAYSPDGKTLLTANNDNTATLWDVATGQEIYTLAGHTDGVGRARFSPDGKLIVTASNDHTLRLWNAATGQYIRQFVGHTDIVDSVAFSPDGKMIASGSVDQTARLWDVATGQQIRTLSGHTDNVSSLAFTPDSKTLITGSNDKTVRFWDVATGKQLREVSVGGAVYSLDVSHDGKMFVTGSDDFIIRLWDVQTGQVLRQMTGHTLNIRVTDFSPDDKTILSSSDDTTARLWDVQTGQEVLRLAGHASFVWGAAFAPEGGSVATIGDGVIKLWNIQRNPNQFQFDAQDGSVDVAIFSPDGKGILTGDSDGTTHLWDLQTGAQIREFGNPGPLIVALAFSPNGKLILTDQVSATTTVILWDVQTGQKLHELTSAGEGQNQNLAFSPDSRYALIGDGVGIVHLMDVETWQEVRRFVGHSQQIFSVAYAPDGKTVFTGTYDNTARLWDVATGQQTEEFQIPESGGNSTAYSPDGKLLAAGTWGGSINIWDLTTGIPVQRLVGHTDQVTVAFTPDGKYLMSAGNDGTIRLWDVNTWQEVRRIITSSVALAAPSPDSQSILDVTGNDSAELVPVDYHVMIQSLCQRLTRDLTADERTAYDLPGSDPTCPSKNAPSTTPELTEVPYSTPIAPAWTPLAPLLLPTSVPATPESTAQS